jgi:hypothetical protein
MRSSTSLRCRVQYHFGAVAAHNRALRIIADEPIICIIMQPVAAVVSIASVRLLNPALASASCSVIVSMSHSERESPAGFHTTSISPLRS